MNNPATAGPTVEYRVVLAVAATDLILTIAEGDTFRLPRVHIPKWTRPAEEITRELRDSWNLNTIVLDLHPSRNLRPACVVAEVMSTTERDSALCMRSIEDVVETDLDLPEREQIHDVLSGTSGTLGPFSRPGWLLEAQEWIQHSLRDRSVTFVNEFRQYNAGNAYALVRFVTRSGPAYWLKATGESNRHELAVTATLSELFPQYLPPFVAKREDWNAWVTEDAGRPLGTSQTLAGLTRAVGVLAELQIQSLEHVPRLEKTGCFDQRLTTVLARLPELIAYLEEAMGQQTSTKVLPLQAPRLAEIGVIVEQACIKMQGLGIPDSLVNGDINLDNILCDDSRITLIDWSEAGIGNPFLTLQQLIQHVVRDGERLNWVLDLRDAYKNKWLTVLTESQIDRAFILMPLLTSLSYLYGRGDWLTSSSKVAPNFQSFARTLARYMDRAAREPALLGAIDQ